MTKHTVVNTFTANIYLGLREQYSDNVGSVEQVMELCQAFCNDVKLCVSVTPTSFVYVDGNEPGAIVGLINYPRFPLEDEEIEDIAVKLAELLAQTFKQHRVSVVFPDETIMVEQE